MQFTHNPNMDQAMIVLGWELPSLWQQLHQTDLCIHLRPTKRKPNIDMPLFNLPPPRYPFPTNTIHYLILKPL